MTIFMTFLQCKHMMKYVAIQLLHELNTNQCLKRFICILLLLYCLYLHCLIFKLRDNELQKKVFELVIFCTQTILIASFAIIVMSINYHALARPIKLSLVSTAKNEKRLIVHSKIYVHKSVNKFALPELYTNVKEFSQL